jgi:hypothetical protein
MGRGRAKAKQTKVARELKYGGPGFEVDRLKAELAGTTPSPFSPAPAVKDDEDEDDDPYAVDDEDDARR